ncbi:hypothetical protein LA345_37435 (plasmid) [Burkholderia vietnamiensis]|nr:hypothetical protein [Burkholderia vietnamiensis]
MNLKYHAATYFALFVLWSLMAIRFGQGVGLLVVVGLATISGFSFVVTLCRYAEAIIGLRTDVDVEAKPLNGSSA